MTRKLPLAALALACVVACTVVPVFAFSDPRLIARGLVAFAGLCLGGTLALCVLHRKPVIGVVAAACLALVLGVVAGPALADIATATVAQPATDTAVVTVPLGIWIASYTSAAVEVVTALVMGLLTIAFRHMPAALVAILKGLLTRELVERSLSFGFNTVADAVKGKALQVHVANQVLANALRYAVAHAPEWFIRWVGGADALRDHIIALLPVADGGTLAASTPTALGLTNADPVKTLALPA